ncbi:uncharacterized protein ACMZJ9_004526 [Mantella aurantiaca]
MTETPISFSESFPRLIFSHRLIIMSNPLNLLLLWGERSGAMLNYCVDQPREAESFVGETLTLPCEFVYPGKKDTVSDVTIIWKARGVPYCGSTKEDEIYDSATNVSSSMYHGRLQLRGDPRTQKVSLILTNVKTNDSNNYCCRVIISFKNKNMLSFQGYHGTRLIVREEHQLKLEQPSSIVAFAGDTVTFLCRFSTKKHFIPSFLFCELYWNPSESPRNRILVHLVDCLDSLKGSILDFKINHTLLLHQGWYTWKVYYSLETNGSQTEKAFGTELVIVERTNTFGIIQTQEAVFQKGVVINCSFTIPEFSNIIRTEVYWMIGDPREDYVYHPNPDCIHPNYQGKTGLVDGSNLLLQDVNVLNNTVFYCRVMIQHCGFNVTEREVIMEEGPGTLLRIYSVNDLCPQSVIIMAGAALKFILLLALFILALVYIKKN